MRRFFERLAAAEEGAAVATVIRTAGSVYRREGARLLVGPEGVRAGMISGGCLEADLAERLRPRLPLRGAEVVAYDAGGDELWALPLGCGGRIELLVEPVTDLHRRMAVEWLAGRPVAVLMHPERGTVCVGGSADVAPGLRETAEAALREGGLRLGENGWLVEGILPPPRLWVAGAGPEAPPLTAGAVALGWRVRVVDPRPGMADPDRFPGARVERLEPGELARRIRPGDYAVLMHHHLELDRACLAPLLAAPLRYLGVLGPLRRTQGLLGATPFPDHLYAPVGLDTGGEGPEPIALAILAELQAVRHGRSGGHLRTQTRVREGAAACASPSVWNQTGTSTRSV